MHTTDQQDYEQRQAQERTEAAQIHNPKLLTELEASQKRIAEIEAEQEAIVTATHSIKQLQRDRKKLENGIAELERLQAECGDSSELAKVALDNFMQWVCGNDNYALLRYRDGITQAAQLAALKPYLPDFIKAKRAELVAMGKQIETTAKTHGINLEKI